MMRIKTAIVGKRRNWRRRRRSGRGRKNFRSRYAVVRRFRPFFRFRFLSTFDAFLAFDAVSVVVIVVVVVVVVSMGAYDCVRRQWQSRKLRPELRALQRQGIDEDDVLELSAGFAFSSQPAVDDVSRFSFVASPLRRRARPGGVAFRLLHSESSSSSSSHFRSAGWKDERGCGCF